MNTYKRGMTLDDVNNISMRVVATYKVVVDSEHFATRNQNKYHLQPQMDIGTRRLHMGAIFRLAHVYFVHSKLLRA